METAAKLLKEAMRLPEDEREELAAKLLDSLEPPPGISIDDKDEIEKRAAEAREACQSAIRLQPAWAAPYEGLSAACLAAGRISDAIAAGREAVKLDPNDASAHFNLAAALARLRELDEARAAVQAGLALDPSFTIRRFRDATNARSNNPTFLALRERSIEGMRLAGVPEG